MQLFQQRVIESCSYSSSIDERSIHPVGELECAEVWATAVGFGESDDDEIAASLGFDLEPVSGSSTPVT